MNNIRLKNQVDSLNKQIFEKDLIIQENETIINDKNVKIELSKVLLKLIKQKQSQA